MNQTLNEDGMLVPGPSKSGQSNIDNNEDTLSTSNSDFESGQRPLDRKRRHREGRKDNIPNKRPRYNRYSASTLEKKVEKSESPIKKLKAHTEKKTCPKDLRYNVQVNIVPHDEFKSDISHIRREAEQKLIGAFTRYHYRRAESNKIKLKQFEQRPNVTGGKKMNNPHQIKNQPRPEKENRTENALVLATELTNKIKKVEEIMKALQNKESECYPCVFTDSSVKGREKETRKIRNEKNHSRRSNRRRDTNRINTQFNQRYIKNLSNCKMTTDQINLLSKGLNFIQTPVLEENRIRQQLLLDFKQFARDSACNIFSTTKRVNNTPFTLNQTGNLQFNNQLR